MKKVLLFLLLIIPGIKYAAAQTSQDEAMALYNIAETDYENKDYLKCDQALVECTTKLGGNSNPKIEFLKIKNLYDGIAAGALNADFHNYNLMNRQIALLFSTVDRNTYPDEKYQQMVMIKVQIADKYRYYLARRVSYILLKNREKKFLTDTVDVYMKQFVSAYNDGWDKLSGHCKSNYKGLYEGKIMYDTVNRRVKYASIFKTGFSYKGINFHGSGLDSRQYIGSIACDGFSVTDNWGITYVGMNANCNIYVERIIRALKGMMDQSGMSKLYNGEYNDVVMR